MEQSTLSSVFAEYSNDEQDFVRRAFSGRNWVSIAQLPTDLRPFAVAKARQEHIDANRQAVIFELGESAKTLQRYGLFERFQYVPSRYSLAEELRRKEKLESQEKTLAVSGKPFVCPKPETKLKHEDGFSVNPITYILDPFERVAEASTRQREIHQSKILHGAFVPGGRTSSSTATRAMLPEMIKVISELIDADWEDVEHSVQIDDDDCIVVAFDVAEIENHSAMNAYMNILMSGGGGGLFAPFCAHRGLRGAARRVFSPEGDWRVEPSR